MDTSPAADPDPTNSAAPGPMSDPTPAPQPRSWFASLSRRGSSNVPLNELAQNAPTLPPSEQPACAQPAHSTTPAAVPATLSPDERADPAPVSLSNSDPRTVDADQAEAEIKLIPRKRAWFAPSSSPRRTIKLRSMDEPPPSVDSTRQDPQVPEIPQLPVTNIIPPTPPRPEVTEVEGERPLEVVPVPIPATRKWFFPASSSQPMSPETEVRAVSPSASSQAGVKPPSLDEQVLNLGSASAGSPSESVLPSAMLSADTSQNLSSLNPSASRFSLSIPFLGRPKVPLNHAVTSHASDPRSELDTAPAPSNDLPTVETAPEATGEFS
jgi:hypothetical protein